MPVISCGCGHTLQVADELVGRQVTCSQCNRIHTVPGATPSQPHADTFADTVFDPSGGSAPSGDQPTQLATPQAAPAPQAAPYVAPPSQPTPQGAPVQGYPQGYPASAPGYPPAQPVGVPTPQPPGGYPGAYPPSAPSHPYAPPQAVGLPPRGPRAPGRWSLITGGVLAMLACLMWGAVGLVVLLSDEILPMKFSAMTSKQQLIYSITLVTTILCGLCFISASFGFAGKTWAAVFTAFVVLVLTCINVYALVDTHDTSKFTSFIIFAVPTFPAMAFSAYGVLQARAYQAHRRRQSGR